MKKWIERLKAGAGQWKLQIICVAAGLALAGTWRISGAGEGKPVGELERPGYGQDAQIQEVYVKGLEEQEVALEIPLESRRYTAGQAQKAYDRLLEELPQRILGENSSLNQVSQDLDLITQAEDYGIRLRWESQDPELIDSLGQVSLDQVPQEGQTLMLRVWMTDGYNPAAYEIPIRLVPPERSASSRRLETYYELVAQADESQRYEPVLTLPEEFEGQPLSYHVEGENREGALAFLGFAAAALVTVSQRSKKQGAADQRRNQLLMDYPEVVSKLMIFLGAGMTITRAWDQVAQDYRQLREQGKIPVRYAYEEMYETCCQIRRRVPESQAYGDFGRRCALPCYIKLATLLEQNRRTGSGKLRDLLKLEMTDAFEQQKHTARRMGEEAGTRLLVPLFLMLAVVMVMIAVPAWLEFS